MFRLLNFIIILFLSYTSYTYAQPIFGQPPSAQPTQPASGPMSPSDFKNAVNQMSQQTNNNLSQQAKQLYPKPQPDVAKSNGQATQPPVAQQPPMPTTVDDSFSVGAPVKAQPGMPSAPTPSQPDTYTGFGSGTKDNKSTAPASSGSSGGWNINY